MELIIVLPIYFALFGGLFFVGELMVNRVRLQIGDHAITWIGSNRFGVDAAIREEGLGMNYLFQEKFDGRGRFEVVRADKDSALNRYASLYKGGITKLNIVMPGWIAGSLAMQNIMTGSKDRVVNGTGEEQDLDWSEQSDFTYFKDYANRYRSWSIHRTAAADFEEGSVEAEERRTVYNRARTEAVDVQEWAGKEAGAMLNDGTLFNVIGDAWLNNATDKQPSVISSAVGSPVRRYLAEFGQ